MFFLQKPARVWYDGFITNPDAGEKRRDAHMDLMQVARPDYSISHFARPNSWEADVHSARKNMAAR